MGEGADGCKNLPRRPDGTGDDDRMIGGIGFQPRQAGRLAVDLAHPIFSLVQLQTVGAAAEGIGQDDVGTGLDETAMVGAHPLGVLEIPQFRGIAGHQPRLEIIGPRRPVGQQPRDG